METVEYCRMSPAATSPPDCLETSSHEMDLGQERDGNYASPSKNTTRETAQGYASLRRSKLDEREYTNIKLQRGNPENEDSKRAPSKNNKLMCALCCIVVFVTVTLVITSTLLAITIWTVYDTRNNSAEYCSGVSSSIDEIRRNVSNLRREVTHLHTYLHDSVSKLEQDAQSLHSGVRNICESLRSCHVVSSYNYVCVNKLTTSVTTQ